MLMVAPMRLGEFRKNAKLTQQAIADGVSCTQGMISGIERGVIEPSLELAARIEEFSGGQVSCRELLRPRTEDAAA